MIASQWINLILGIWLITSPFLFGDSEFSYVAVANGIALGGVLVECSSWVLATMEGAVCVSRFEAFCGLWLVLSPHVLAYRVLSLAAYNDVVVGSIVLAVNLLDAWVLTHS